MGTACREEFTAEPLARTTMTLIINNDDVARDRAEHRIAPTFGASCFRRPRRLLLTSRRRPLVKPMRGPSFTRCVVFYVMGAIVVTYYLVDQNGVLNASGPLPVHSGYSRVSDVLGLID